MAITANGTAAVSSGGTGNATVTNATGVTVGEYLVMTVTCHASTTPSTASTPSGWSLLQSVTGGQNNYTFGKVAVAGDVSAANYTVTMTPGSGTPNWEAFIQRFGGVDNTTPIDVAGGTVDSGYTGGTTSQTITLPSITTVTANAWQIAFIAEDDTPISGSGMATGFTQLATATTVAAKLAQRTLTSAGASGTSTWTWSPATYTSPDLQGITFGLRAATGSASHPPGPSNAARICASNFL